MTAQDSTSSKRNRLRITLVFLIPALLALAAGGGWYAVERFQHKETSGNTTVAGDTVALGADYYLMVKLVELGPVNADGEPWDSLNDSGPDIMVDVLWRGQRVFRSTVIEDSFVGKWSAAEIDLRKIALSGEATSVESVIKAARISIAPEEEIEIVVRDADLLGEGERAGSLHIPSQELVLGEHTYVDPAPGIKRIVLKTVPMDASPEMFD